MTRALEMFIIEGISTSIPVHQKIMADPDFQAGNFDTHFLTAIAAQWRQLVLGSIQVSRSIDNELALRAKNPLSRKLSVLWDAQALCSGTQR